MSLEAALGACLALVALEWVRRAVWLTRLGRSKPTLKPCASGPGSPKVSLIVPARNEERNIARCLDSLLAQQYPDYEIVVIDDRSSDATPQILARYAKAHAKIKVVRIEKTPPGWTGKNYGLFTGSKTASGEWMLFTDADTRHSSLSVSTAMAAARAENADFLTLAPETESRSFWEKTVQPLAVSSLALWFQGGGRILANGQYILLKKAVYEKAGGNESVKDQVIEDVELAKKVAAAGGTVKFLDGTLLYSTRMYNNLREIRTGWTRIFVYLFEKNIPAILHKIFLFLFFSLLPFAVLAWQFVEYSPLLCAASAAVCALIITIRWQGNKRLRTNPLFALLHPLGSLVMVWILAECAWRIALKAPSAWRGDLYK